MWKSSRKALLVRRAVSRNDILRRNLADEVEAVTPAPKPKKSKAGLLFKLLGLTTVTGAGVVSYAWYDANFKTKIQTNIPYSGEMLTYIHQYFPSEKPVFEMPQFSIPSIPFLSKDKPIVADEMTSLKPLFESKQQPEIKPLSDIVPTTQTILAEKDFMAEKVLVLPSAADIEKQILAKEASDAAENAALEVIAQEQMDKCGSLITLAVSTQTEAADAIDMHREQFKKAMAVDANDDEWNIVAEAFDAKEDAVHHATDLTGQARMELEKLQYLLHVSRDNDVTKSHPVIISAQDQLNKLTYSLDSAVTKTKSAASSLKMVSEYKDLVQQGKKQFNKELESIVPDVTVGKKGKQLDKDELNSLIAHAHRRIDQLQRKLAERQALEEERIDKATSRQRQEDDLLHEDMVGHELERQRGELLIEQQHKEFQILQETEEQTRQHLTRQMAAHSEHLADVLRVQRRELTAEYQGRLREQLLQERINFQNEVAESIARLKGIEAAVDARANVEKDGRKAQELWLASQTLVRSISRGDQDLSPFDDRKVPLADEVRAVKEAGNGHVFVNAIINNMPEESLTDGVYTQAFLTQRFAKVKKICARVSMIDETGGSLIKFALSYVQSMLMFNRVRALAVDDDVAVAELKDTFKILSHAERFLAQGDLEQAVRFVSQLRGESRRVASDWLRDAILFLETKQAADSLLGHASASGIGSLF